MSARQTPGGGGGQDGKKKRKKQCEALCNDAWREDKKGKKSMTKRVTPNTGCCSVKQQKAHIYSHDLTLHSIDFAKAQLQMTRCSTRTTHHKAGSNVCYWMAVAPMFSPDLWPPVGTKPTSYQTRPNPTVTAHRMMSSLSNLCRSLVMTRSFESGVLEHGDT